MNCTAEERNQKIIDAVIAKAERVCPGSLALIGIYGSFLTGDIHPRSDLDLLILINDDRAWRLGTAFIQDDLQIGHDLYCTSWESLRQDARYTHPHIAKLLDAKIVWCADEKHREALEALRRETRARLDAPFGPADYENAENALRDAERFFARAMTARGLSQTRSFAGGVLYYAENALALLNKAYFRLGVYRRYEELSALKKRPENLCALLENVVSARTETALKTYLTALLRAVEATFDAARPEAERRPVRPDTIGGTYEEMYSNWRGKMRLAADRQDRYLAFSSLASLDNMLAEIRAETDIGPYDAMSAYDPKDLRRTAENFDRLLQAYLSEYQKAGVPVHRFPDVDAFAAAYRDGDS